MLTKEQIIHVLKDTNTLRDFKIFLHNGQIGLIYTIPFDDYLISVERFKSFNSIQDLYDFINLYKNCDKIEIEDYTQIDPTIKFIKNSKEYTVEIMNQEKLEEQTKLKNNLIKSIQRLSSINSYLTNKIQSLNSSSDISRLQEENKTLKKEIDDLQKSNLRKFKLHKKSKSKLLPSGSIDKILDNFDEETLYIDESLNLQQLSELNNTLRERYFTLYQQAKAKETRTDVIKLQLIYKSMKDENIILKNQKAYLLSLQDLNIFHRFKLTPAKIQNNLKAIYGNFSSPSQEHLDEQVKNFSNLENAKYELLSTNIYNENLINFLNDFDTEDNLTNKISVMNKYKSKSSDTKNDNSIYYQRPKKKSEIIYENLTEQFEKNLTKDEKDSLIIYNSSLFLLINEITSKENYKDLSKSDLKKIIRNSEHFKPIIKSLSTLKSCVSNTHNETSDIFAKVLNSGDIIGSLLERIETIGKIQNKIILPEDCTLYRGIYTDNDFNFKKPNKGKFMSTSLDPCVANMFTKNKNYILTRFHLKKGMPVTGIFPYIVAHSKSCNELFLIPDSESDLPKKEILLNMEHYKTKNEPELKEISNYDFSDNTVNEYPPYKICDYELCLIPELQQKTDEYSR